MSSLSWEGGTGFSFRHIAVKTEVNTASEGIECPPEMDTIPMSELLYKDNKEASLLFIFSYLLWINYFRLVFSCYQFT